MTTDLVEPLLQRFTEACLEVFGPAQVVAVIAHGSAVKGGAIPGFSDADFMVLLRSEAFGPVVTSGVDMPSIPDERAFALQERIGHLPWRDAGFSYPQAGFLDPGRLPDWWTGPIPGSYRVLYGRLPDGMEATSESVARSSRRWLAGLPRFIAGDVRNFADSPDDQIPRRLRLVGTSVTPAIFSLATLTSAEPVELWSGTKFEALETLRRTYPSEPGPPMAADFYRRVAVIYGAASFDVVAGRESFKLGVRFLRWVEAMAAPRLVDW